MFLLDISRRKHLFREIVEIIYCGRNCIHSLMKYLTCLVFFDKDLFFLAEELKQLNYLFRIKSLYSRFYEFL